LEFETATEEKNVGDYFNNLKQGNDRDADVQAKRAANIRQQTPNVILWRLDNQLLVQLFKSQT